MTPYLKPIVLLLGVALLGCIHKASFEYEVEPGAPVARLGTVAMDPRELVWEVEGQRPIDPWEYRAAVVKELRQRGYRFVKAEGADLWLDIIAVSPAGSGNERTPLVMQPSGAQSSARNQRGMGRPAEGSTFGAPGGPVGAEGPVYNARPVEVTTVIRLVERASEKTLWTGTAVIPPHRPGSGPEVTAAEWIGRLLAPLPPCAKPVPAASAQAEGGGNPR
jgi:hypothetical protein